MVVDAPAVDAGIDAAMTVDAALDASPLDINGCTPATATDLSGMATPTVTFGGAGSLLGTVASTFGIAQTQSIAEFFLTGSMAKVLTLLLIVTILMIRPQGLVASKIRR